MTSKFKKISENIVEINGKRFVKEDSKGWLDIPELKISVEIEVHDKGKSWDKLDLSKKEDQLLTHDQVVFLANSKYAKQLKMDGSSSKDDFFIKQPFNLSKKNGYVAGFYVGSGYCNLGCSGGSGGSGSYLGVRFCKKISKTSKRKKNGK